MNRNLRGWITALALTAAAGSSGAACDFTAVESRINQFLLLRPAIPGVSVAAGFVGEPIWTAHFRDFDGDNVIPLASSTKLLSGVLMMSLHQSGELPLSTSAGTYLDSFVGTKGEMTVAQMFSHTSGFEDNSDLNNPMGVRVLAWNSGLTLAEAADTLGCCEAPFADPGTQFAYGGASMHAAGRMAELATGEDYERLFQQRVASPLGIESIDFQGLGPTQNYRVAGGAQASLRDYSAILEDLLRSYQGRGGLLTRQNVNAMFANRMEGLPIGHVPAGEVDNFGYGVGVWLERDDSGQVTSVTSEGALGYSPWIDLQGGFYFVYAIEALRTTALFTHQKAVLDDVREIVRSGDCDRVFGNGFD